MTRARAHTNADEINARNTYSDCGCKVITIIYIYYGRHEIVKNGHVDVTDAVRRTRKSSPRRPTVFRASVYRRPARPEVRRGRPGDSIGAPRPERTGRCVTTASVFGPYKGVFFFYRADKIFTSPPNNAAQTKRVKCVQEQ